MTIAISGPAGAAGTAAAPEVQAQPAAAAPAASTAAAEDKVTISAAAQELPQPVSMLVLRCITRGSRCRKSRRSWRSARARCRAIWERPRRRRRASWLASTAQARFIYIEVLCAIRVRRPIRVVRGTECRASFRGSSSSVDLIFFRRRRIVLFVQFVLSFQPIFKRVSAVNSAVAFMNLVRTPLNFVQAVSVFVFRAVFGLARGKSGLEDVANYNLVCFLHIGPSFCTA
jgi:hypothetical protein